MTPDKYLNLTLNSTFCLQTHQLNMKYYEKWVNYLDSTIEISSAKKLTKDYLTLNTLS